MRCCTAALLYSLPLLPLLPLLHSCCRGYLTRFSLSLKSLLLKEFLSITAVDAMANFTAAAAALPTPRLQLPLVAHRAGSVLGRLSIPV